MNFSSIPLKRLTAELYYNAVPFYLKNGFSFMGKDEEDRYKNGKDDTIAMYFDLMSIY